MYVFRVFSVEFVAAAYLWYEFLGLHMIASFISWRRISVESVFLG